MKKLSCQWHAFNYKPIPQMIYEVNNLQMYLLNTWVSPKWEASDVERKKEEKSQC